MINVTDLYNTMLEIKNGLPQGGIRGCMTVTKKECKKAKISWGFVENAVSILNLYMYRNGKHGYVISKRSAT